MKDDVKNLTTEYEGLRHQYSKLQARNDELKHEAQTSRRELEANAPKSFRELEQITQRNETLASETEELKKEVFI